MKIIDKVRKKLNDTFVGNFRKYLEGEYPDVSFENYLDLCTMQMFTTWDSEDPVVCEKIKIAAAAYEAAYLQACQETWNI